MQIKKNKDMKVSIIIYEDKKTPVYEIMEFNTDGTEKTADDQ